MKREDESWARYRTPADYLPIGALLCARYASLTVAEERTKQKPPRPPAFAARRVGNGVDLDVSGLL
ncbi:hypothetical protein [Collimonas arenae]|uniref:hypothetical protein n=1 Tax=Collimonas arenae TaxID=279058 RepID=UPI000FE1441D|nr:hypothetical protein [Collimonas arenae]